MKKIFFSLLIFTIFITACTPEENPFMPKDKGEPVNYNIFIDSSGFNPTLNAGIVIDASCSCNVYSDSPYVVAYNISSSWSPSGPWTLYDNQYSGSGDENGIVKYGVNEQNIAHSYDVSADGTKPTVLNVYQNGVDVQYFHEENNHRYSLTYPVIYIEVTDAWPSFLYLERFYRVEGMDMYARKTTPRVMSVKYCRVDATFSSYSNVNTSGHIISQPSADRYIIKFYFPGWALKDIWDFYGGNDTLTQITVTDLNNKVSLAYPTSIPINLQYQEYHGDY